MRSDPPSRYALVVETEGQVGSSAGDCGSFRAACCCATPRVVVEGSSAPRLRLRMPKGKISSSSPLGTVGRRCAAELERRYAGSNIRGDVGMSMAPAVEEAPREISDPGISSKGESCSIRGILERWSVSMSSATLLELRRERIAGVWGV